jgi:wobble nucleotide-excising tRNase
MINSLHLKKVATYDDTGIAFLELKKINFIYGSNGSGKTTITKFLYAPGNGIFANCQAKWAGSLPLKTEVYNKEFRDRNFSRGDIDGVFTLGQATKEQEEKIESLKEQRKKIIDEGKIKKDSIEKLNTQLLSLEDQFREEVWTSIYKKHESYFKEGFRGFMNNKEVFKTKFLQEAEVNSSVLRDLDKLKSHSVTILGSKPVVMDLIGIIGYEGICNIESDNIWNKKIIGKTDVNIAALIQRLNMNDWVNRGRAFLSENETCPFCQQETITNGFRRQLEEYFDETFVLETKKVKQLAASYNMFTKNLLNHLASIEETQQNNPSSKLKLDLLSAYVKTLESLFENNITQINIKDKEPSRTVDIKDSQSQLDKIIELVKEANIEIDKHNLIANNFEKSKKELISCIWKYVTEDFKVITEDYLKNKNNLQKGILGLETKHKDLAVTYRKIHAKIIEESKNLTSVQPSVDQINMTLRSYGFNNFMIVPSISETNKYQIQREDGELAANTLSEGEVTFITFLYFLQLVKGSIKQEDISVERILVIDDPISSLDSSILFVISSLIRSLLSDIRSGKGNIKQLILLTHNVYFHKETSFISSSIKECKDTHYWILRKQTKHTTLQHYGMKNPIQSSYELLWREIKNRTECSTISIQNTMRRILENYFKILGGISENNIIDLFEILEEREICRSLMLWINDGSHSIPDDIFIERQDDIIEKYYQVFKKIFALTRHDQHFNMMMGEDSEIAKK